MTLAEVVVSTASISVVTALLIPSLSDTRYLSQRTQCLKNLGHLGSAAAIHAMTDPLGLGIPVHPLMGTAPGALGEYEWGGKSGIGEPYSGGDPASSKWGTQEGRGPATRRLNQIIYGDVFPDYVNDPGPNNINWLADAQLELDSFHCPADTGYAGHHYSAWRESRLSSYDHYGNSYSASAHWVGMAGGGCTIMSNSPLLRPLADVPNPGRTLLFIENAGRFAYRINYGMDGCSSLTGPLSNDASTGIKGWHGPENTFQVAYVDGHAAAVYIRGHEQPQPELRSYPFGDYETWRCVTIRGPDWQIDTLPAPPVETNIPCVTPGVVLDVVY